MPSESDVRATKSARSEFAKRGVDVTLADIRVNHGVLFIRGQVKPLRSSNINDIKSEMELIARVLRQKPEIRDVILDCSYRSI